MNPSARWGTMHAPVMDGSMFGSYLSTPFSGAYFSMRYSILLYALITTLVSRAAKETDSVKSKHLRLSHGTLRVASGINDGSFEAVQPVAIVKLLHRLSRRVI